MALLLLVKEIPDYISIQPILILDFLNNKVDLLLFLDNQIIHYSGFKSQGISCVNYFTHKLYNDFARIL
jgi:hypothetical protein